jgi:ketosteroid isomerase-like protein
MRHLLLPASIVLTLSACGSAVVDQPGPAPVDPRLYQEGHHRVAVPVRTAEEIARAERDTAIAVLKGYAQDGFQASIPLLDPEGNLSFPGLSEATDRAAALKVLGDLFGPFSGRAFAVGRTWQPAHVVVVEWTMTGTHSGDWMTVKPTSKPVTVRGLGIYWFDQNGLVSDTHLFFDAGAVLAQIGAPPKGVEALAVAQLAAGDPVVATGADSERQNVAIVNASWDALEARNEAGYLAAISEDIDVTRLDRASSERGKVERRRFFKALASGIGSLAQTPQNAWGVGPFVIEEYSITGVHTGKLADIAPSGHALRLHYVDVDEMRDGKIVRTTTFANSLELYAEIGQVDKAAPGASTAVIK